MGEFDRIARLAKRFGLPPQPAIGIGDDCALVPPIDRWTAWKVDASVEGVHFDRSFVSLEDAAARAVEAAMSDLAAAGATPAWSERGGCGLLVAFTLPAALTEPEFDSLVEGVAKSAERVGAVVLGGNLAGGPVLSVTTTAIGRIESRGMRRHGARPGDGVYLTGVVGAAGLGLRALQCNASDARFEPFRSRWRSPRARIAEGLFIAQFAHATVDLSDGLAADVGHIAIASSCGVVLDIASLPMLADQRECAKALGSDAVELALHAGEDYEICFTAESIPPAPDGLAAITAIGECIETPGVFVRDERGVRPIAARGFNHFA
jgi:thiamine-monophosphate kinase